MGPKISRTAWTSAFSSLGTSASFCNYELLRAGNQPYGTWDSYTPATEYFVCEVCQCKVDLGQLTPCPYHSAGIHCLVAKRKAPVYGKFVFDPGVNFLVFDEGHRANGLDSLNSELVVAAKRQGIKTLMLSATPAHSPLQMRALGYLLDLHNDKEPLTVPGRFGAFLKLPKFYTWASRYNCRPDPRFKGFKWFAGREERISTMRELRSKIIPSRGIRVTRDSIPGFPTCDITAELYDIDDPAQLNRAYREMQHALEQLRRRGASDKDASHPLTKMLRAQQEIELLKVPVMAELASDYEQKGISIVFFVKFTQTIEELFKRFPDAGVVDGSQKWLKRRDGTIADFQANKLRRLIVNNKAGSVSMSLQDLHGGFPRGGLVSAGFSADELQQIFGRLPRDGGKSHSFYRVLFAAGTVEVNIWRAVKAKLDAGEALIDSDLAPDNLPIPAQ